MGGMPDLVERGGPKSFSCDIIPFPKKIIQQGGGGGVLMSCFCSEKNPYMFFRFPCDGWKRRGLTYKRGGGGVVVPQILFLFQS